MATSIQNGANLYAQSVGSYSEKVEIPHIDTRNPLPNDIKYPIGKRWVNTRQNNVFSLISFSFSGLVKTANWFSLTIDLFPIVSAGLSPDLNGASTVITASGTVPGAFVLLGQNNITGEIGPVGVPTVGTNTFTIFSVNANNTSNYYYISVT